MNHSCTSQYRYSKGFDSCLYLHGEPLRMTLLACTISIFGLFVILFLMLAAAYRLLPNLMKETRGTIHSFLSQAELTEDHNSRSTEEQNSNTTKYSDRSLSSTASHKYSQQSDKNN